MKEQKIQEKQLQLIEKKEEKSKWYHKQKKVQKTTADKKTKGKSLMEMWRSDSSCSLGSNPNDSDETVHNILSSDSELNIVSDVSPLVQSKVDESNSQSQMADVEVISGNESDDLFSCSQQVVNQSNVPSEMSEMDVNPVEPTSALVPSEDFPLPPFASH